MFLYPLTRASRIQLARAFATIPRVDISIECVLEDQMGKTFVDSPDNPQAYLLELDGFFCYYAGDLTSDTGRAFVAKTPNGRMLMTGSSGWHEVVQSAFDAERLIHIKRYSYASDSLSVEHLQQLAANNPNTPHVRRIDAALAATKNPYVEIGAFESPEDFFQRGIGYCMTDGDTIIGGAYSSLVCSNAIEISIVVDPAYRRKGIATALSCQLLLWCLAHHVAPHWDAANAESCGLAEKLGYSEKAEYAAYFLK